MDERQLKARYFHIFHLHGIDQRQTGWKDIGTNRRIEQSELSLGNGLALGARQSQRSSKCKQNEKTESPSRARIFGLNEKAGDTSIWRLPSICAKSSAKTILALLPLTTRNIDIDIQITSILTGHSFFLLRLTYSTETSLSRCELEKLACR
jgi:hypothetical protein